MRELLSILLLLGSVPLFGASWKPIGPWFGNVFSLAVERSNPDHLYALACKDDSCNGSVWRSTDGGNWWAPAGKELTASDVVWIAVHPTVPGTLYVGTLSRPEEHPGIAKSTDGGSSWHWLFTDGDSAEGAGALANPPGRLCFGPGNPPSIWLPNVNLHSRSSDDGAHWTSFYVVVGDHEYSDANGFAFSSSDPNLVWAYGTSGDYLRKSVDGGATWARVTRKSYGFIGWCSPAFLIDPADPNRLLVGGGGSNGIVASTDGGETWLSLDDFPDTVTVQSLTADPSKFNTLYASTNDGIFKSTNGGRSWSKIGAGLPLDGEKNVVKSIVVDPRSSNVLWASVYNNGIYRSTDGGSTWRESDNGMSTAPVDGLWVGESGTVLAGTSAGSFRRDGADRWTRDDSIPDIDSLAGDPKNPQIVYGGGDRGLRRSNDGGKSWRAAGNFHHEITRIAVARDGRVLYAASGTNLYKSADRGEHWKRSDHGLPAASTLMLESGTAGNVFAVVDGRGLWHSSDGGSSWQPVKGEMPKQITDLAVDPANSDHIAVSVKISAFHNEGVLYSNDGGRTWESAGDGMNNQVVSAVAFGPASILFAGGSEGVFCSRDGGRTWTAFGDGLTATNVTRLNCSKKRLYAGTNAGVFSVDLQ